MSLSVEQIERVSQRILYELARRDEYKPKGSTLTEIDASIGEARAHVAQALKAAMDAEKEKP